MKLSDIHFPSEANKDPEFRYLNSILNNTYKSEWYSLHEEIAARSKTSIEFIDNFIADERTHKTQLYAELLKRERPNKMWYTIRSMFGGKEFKTISDAGGLLVGDKTFGIVIPSGGGDGITRVAIFDDPDDFNDNLMNYFTLISGDFGIYDYDCSDRSSSEPIRKLNGRYAVYFLIGFVAFVKTS